MTYEFEFPPFSFELKKHYEGVIAILFKDDKELKLGSDEDGNVYMLHNFEWENVNERENNIRGKKYENPQGLVEYMFDQYIKVDLTEDCKNILVKILEDLKNDRSLDWVPPADYYTFEGNDLVCNNEN